MDDGDRVRHLRASIKKFEASAKWNGGRVRDLRSWYEGYAAAYGNCAKFLGWLLKDMQTAKKLEVRGTR